MEARLVAHRGLPNPVQVADWVGHRQQPVPVRPRPGGRFRARLDAELDAVAGDEGATQLDPGVGDERLERGHRGLTAGGVHPGTELQRCAHPLEKASSEPIDSRSVRVDVRSLDGERGSTVPAAGFEPTLASF